MKKESSTVSKKVAAVGASAAADRAPTGEPV
jgi:hypothetical protein